MKRRRVSKKKRPAVQGGEMILAAVFGIAGALWCITALTARLSPELSILAKAQVERAVTERVVGRLQETLAEGNAPPVSLEQDENGRAVALKSDTAALNCVRDEFLRGLNRDLEGLRREKVGVPLGSLTPWPVFYGAGPEVKVGIYAAPTVTAEFVSHFSQAGVNQTRHVIELEVTVRLELLLPGGTESQEVKTAAPVSETVIVGTPPEEYFEAGTVRE